MKFKAKTMLRIGNLLNQRGMTLVEVLLSVVILSTSSMFVLEALAKVAQVQAAIESRMTAYSIASSRMADIEIARVNPEMLEVDVRGVKRVGQNTFRWNTTVATYDEEFSIQSVSLGVQWQQGEDLYTMNFDTLSRMETVEGEL